MGHTEAICTGTLAGFNAARKENKTMTLPESLAIGDAIAYVRNQMIDHNRLDLKFTFSGSVLFERMQEKGLYTTDIDVIKRRVSDAGTYGCIPKTNNRHGRIKIPFRVRP